MVQFFPSRGIPGSTYRIGNTTYARTPFGTRKLTEPAGRYIHGLQRWLVRGATRRWLRYGLSFLAGVLTGIVLWGGR